MRRAPASSTRCGCWPTADHGGRRRTWTVRQARTGSCASTSRAASRPGGEDAATLVAQIRDSGTQDLFVMSHGWGNSEAAADQLYNAMFNLIQSSPGVPSTARFLGVYWPSLWFPDAPGGAAARPAAARGTSRRRRPGRPTPRSRARPSRSPWPAGSPAATATTSSGWASWSTRASRASRRGSRRRPSRSGWTSSMPCWARCSRRRRRRARPPRRTPARPRCSPPTTRATHTGSSPSSWGARRRRATCRASATSSARCGTVPRTRCGWAPTSR